MFSVCCGYFNSQRENFGCDRVKMERDATFTYYPQCCVSVI